MNNGKVFLSVAAPAFNEEEGIRDVVSAWAAWLEKHESDYEIVVCDDGSSDRTWTILENLARANDKIKNVRLKRNRGASIALSCAIAHSSGRWVLMIDSDGQFDIADYTALRAKQLATGARAVIGERVSKKNDLLTKIGSAASSRVANFLLGSHVRDFSSVFKLIDGDLARCLHFESTGFDISTESTARLLERKITIASVPIQHHPRYAGKSKLKILQGARMRYLFIRYLHMRSRLLKKNVLRHEPIFASDVLKGENWEKR